MDWSKIGEVAWTAVNSPVGISVIAAVVLMLLNRLYAKKPAWRKFEGTIVAAVKGAEKLIPDETESKGLKRFDQALKTVLEIYKKVEGKRPSEKVEAELAEGISLVHNKLEAEGVL